MNKTEMQYPLHISAQQNQKNSKNNYFLPCNLSARQIGATYLNVHNMVDPFARCRGKPTKARGIRWPGCFFMPPISCHFAF